MTPELERELIDAWNSSFCIPAPDPILTALDRLRADWAEANADEREAFKEEIIGKI